MEKKTRRSLTEAAFNNETVIVELASGLKWEAKLLPVSTLVQLTDGLIGESMVDVASVTVALTGGSFN